MLRTPYISITAKALREVGCLLPSSIPDCARVNGNNWCAEWECIKAEPYDKRKARICLEQEVKLTFQFQWIISDPSIEERPRPGQDQYEMSWKEERVKAKEEAKTKAEEEAIEKRGGYSMDGFFAGHE